MSHFTIFFDSRCPLCVNEMTELERLDKNNYLRFEDIHASDFNQRFPEISVAKANKVLHGQHADGRLLYGLDVTAHIWPAIGHKRWTRCLRWPVIRWFADAAYLFFARFRYRISYLMTGVARLDDANCSTCNIGGKND